ncbi:CcmD family protein [Metallumcola ferriviriculae]|uniref:CcmD family protein n=1 Tax=Metallumcola ferriviriculae TaxID=3039180 RepID=A0AAU0UKF5_9FIRM|nr:CcmD family protein [Desulfitibacteraceae bacterium MK1]
MSYVAAAYGVIFALIFMYTLILGGRQNKLAKEVEMLQEAVRDR